MVIVNALIENDKLHRKQEVRVKIHSQLTLAALGRPQWIPVSNRLADSIQNRICAEAAYPTAAK